MPTYTWHCKNKDCNGMQDKSAKMADRDIPPDFCDKCGGKEMGRPIQGGSGFMWKCAGSHNSEYNKTGRRKGS